MRCFTSWRRVTGPIGGKWISYTAAQVALRRAAQMVAVTVCVGIPPTPGMPPPPCNCPPPVPLYPPLMPPGGLVAIPPAPPIWATTYAPVLVPVRRVDDVPVHDVPEPASALVLAVAVLGLWRARR